MLGDRNEDDSQECIFLICESPKFLALRTEIHSEPGPLLRFISRSVMYGRMRWRVHGIAYIQSRSVSSRVWQYFCWLQFRTPDRVPCNVNNELREARQIIGTNAPSAGTVWLITSPSAVTASVTAPVGPTAATSVESGDIRPFRRNLEDRRVEDM